MKKPKKVVTSFASYVLENSIGEGGSGSVFSAKDDNGNSFAIKILDSNKATKEKLKRFKNEYIFCSRNIHSNIVVVSDHGLTEEQTPFFVMPLYTGSLRDLIGKISPKEASSIFNKILDGVEAAHMLGADCAKQFVISKNQESPVSLPVYLLMQVFRQKT